MCTSCRVRLEDVSKEERARYEQLAAKETVKFRKYKQQLEQSGLAVDEVLPTVHRPKSKTPVSPAVKQKAVKAVKVRPQEQRLTRTSWMKTAGSHGRRRYEGPKDRKTMQLGGEAVGGQGGRGCGGWLAAEDGIAARRTGASTSRLTTS